MNLGVNMEARKAITKKLAKEYFKSNKKEKSKIIDFLVQTIGWSRKHTIVALKKASERKGHIKKYKDRKPRGKTYTEDTRVALEKIWALSGFQNSKSLASQMDMWVSTLTRFNEIDISEETEKQLLKISAATIDRLLSKARKSMVTRGKTTTKGGDLLKNSIKIRKAMDEVEQRPGFVEADTVAHCGNTLAGEFARTITLTDVYTGWTENQAIRNNAHKWIIEGLDAMEGRFPYLLTGFDSDNGSEFINYELVKWVNKRDLFFTRSRPYKKNDNAHVEQKNNDFVRRVAFYYRYDTKEELDLLNELYSYARLRYNFFTPTRKAIGFTEDSKGRRKRLYDKPKTPYVRVMESKCLDSKAKRRLEKEYKELNPAELTRNIVRIQSILIGIAKEKPETRLEYYDKMKEMSR
jgi:hypothetical protein